MGFPIIKTYFKKIMKSLGSLMAILAIMTLSNWAYSLSKAQCDAFASDGKIPICHATGSANNPYVIIKVAVSACVDAHAGHEGDYVAVDDPTCSGGGCLPQDAPCDASLPCCDGMSCDDGTCHAVCVPVPDPNLPAICTAAVIVSGPCNTCCFDNPTCGSSGFPGNECGNAGGMGCTNQEQNEACLAAIIEVGCGDECNVCAP